jgi:peptidyl-prolyl cis-trans isomerase B (cyclophilin B)
MRFTVRASALLLLPAALVLFAGGCKGNAPAAPATPQTNLEGSNPPITPPPGSTMSAGAKAALAPPTQAQITAAKDSKTNPLVKMVTVKGTILIKLFPKDAPISCANFENLVNAGFYNGLTFHRITDLNPGTPSKIVQGGDPNGDGSGGPGYAITGEFPQNGVNNPLTHVAGAVAMARSGDPNSAGSQFYICVNPVHFLDGSYAVFGQVIKGLSVANKLQVGDKMTSVTMEK